MPLISPGASEVSKNPRNGAVDSALWRLSQVQLANATFGLRRVVAFVNFYRV
jgi:hypothetical protein